MTESPRSPVVGAAAPRSASACYVCKKISTEVHAFYDRLCLACGEFNLAKRTELADLCVRLPRTRHVLGAGEVPRPRRRAA